MDVPIPLPVAMVAFVILIMIIMDSVSTVLIFQTLQRIVMGLLMTKECMNANGYAKVSRYTHVTLVGLDTESLIMRDELNAN